MTTRNYSELEQALIEKARRYLPGGTLGNLDYGIVISSGVGGRVKDMSGNDYVDYLLGSGPMLIGHAHPEVIDAVQTQLARGTTFFANNEQAILLAEEIVNAVPCAEKVRFTSTGTEATLYALRAARSYRSRDKILKFEGGYHGMHDYALMSVTTSNPAEFPISVSDSAGIPKSVQDEVLVAPFNNLEITSEIIEKYHDQLGAVIVEPFQRLLPPETGFLQGLRDLTIQYGIPLIFDEVVTGFRFAYGGAQEFYGVEPDLCTMGKVMAGGFPLALIAGKSDIMDHFDKSLKPDSFMPQIGTLNGNPVAAAAGMATLDILKREGTYEKLHATGQRLRSALQSSLSEAEIPSVVIGEAPLFDVVFTDSTKVIDYRGMLAGDKAKLNRFNRHLLEHGVLKGDTKFYVSLAHNEEDIERTEEAFKSAAAELR